MEAGNAEHSVVEVASRSKTEADAGIGHADAISQACWRRNELTSGGGRVRGAYCRLDDGAFDAEQEVGVTAKERLQEASVCFGGTVEGREVLFMGFEIVIEASKFGERLFDVADEAKVGARGADDAIGKESALRVVCGKKYLWAGNTLDAEPEFPG